MNDYKLGSLPTRIEPIFFTIWLWIICTALSAQHRKVTLSGHVKEAVSLETLPGVTIALTDNYSGTLSNTFGFYSLTLPSTDTVKLQFSCLGYRTQQLSLPFSDNLQLDVLLVPDNELIQEVEVYADQEPVNRSPQMSTIKIPVSQMKNIPGLLGEKDMLKVLQLMPGVQKGREGNSGLYIRGGGPDQNLILLDDAIVYNAFHLFGFYSLFNGDALKSIELTKGGFPARFGGRLSSVVEMHMKEGNKKKIHGEAGMGVISSKLTLEGPLVKNKASFLLSGRRTYLDILSRPFLSKERYVSYYFYDVNAKVNYDLNASNKVYLSSYTGKDKFGGVDRDDSSSWKANLFWTNLTATARWNHIFSEQLFSNTSVIFSRYKLAGIEDNISLGGYSPKGTFSSNIRDMMLKSDFDFYPSMRHTLKSGMQIIYHVYNPVAITYGRSNSLPTSTPAGKNIEALETAMYLENTFVPNLKMSLNTGLRLSSFILSEKTYVNPELRVNVAIHLTDNLSLKGAYSAMSQYIHLLTYTKIGLPNDLWVPATKNVLPQRSSQWAAGFARDFPQQNLYVTVEGYYKINKNIIAYKNGANYLNLEEDISANWESKVTRGNGWSYGAEFLLHRKYGKFSGWMGYTLSWSQVQFDSLNGGKKYFAPYDRRHDASVVLVYKPHGRITFSTTWVYGTGNRITMPIGVYSSSDFYIDRTLFTDKNVYRMPAYHRWDAGLQFHKTNEKGYERTWEISVYNLYNRKNPYFYFIATAGTSAKESYINRKLRQITLFPILPSVSYRIKF